MFALLCFVLTVLASPFKSKSRLEAENVALRHQLIVLRPRFYGLIKEFAELTGIPVILNTSFNRQEPIVARPSEAISCYLRTQMDVLVLSDFYVTDRKPPPR